LILNLTFLAGTVSKKAFLEDKHYFTVFYTNCWIWGMQQCYLSFSASAFDLCMVHIRMVTWNSFVFSPHAA